MEFKSTNDDSNGKETEEDGDHDVEMKETAEERTVTKAAAGWRYPKRVFRRPKKKK